MKEIVPPSQSALKEALVLSSEILRNIELGEIPLSSACLKASRLARLLNDFDHQRIFEMEVSGYPAAPDGVEPEIWRLLALAGRVYKKKIKEEISDRANVKSLAGLEQAIKTSSMVLENSRDANVSISSANPNLYLAIPAGNKAERDKAQTKIFESTATLSARSGFLHSYVSKKYYELKFSDVAGDIFGRMREKVDASISEAVPTAVQKLSAIYENLSSDNPEDWSNAVHGCRRLLQDLADSVFPPQAEREVNFNGKNKLVKLGPDQYINRLVAYIQDNSDSRRFQEIVGSSLAFMGDRLDAIFQAAQKGSHTIISEKAEADRYVIYTYMLVADILSLSGEQKFQPIMGDNHWLEGSEMSLALKVE